MLRKYSVRKRHPAQGPEPRPTPLTTMETRLFRTFTSVNRREPVRIWCEHVHAHVHGVVMLNCCVRKRVRYVRIRFRYTKVIHYLR